MSDTLNKILVVKAEEIAAAKKYCSLASLHDEVESDRGARAELRCFEATMRAKIAEVKKTSPSKGLLHHDFQPAKIGQSYASILSSIRISFMKRVHGGDCILLIIAALDHGLMAELEACAHELAHERAGRSAQCR